MRRLLLVLLVLTGCKGDGAEASEAPPSAARHPLAGVYPEQWQCDRIASLDTLGQLLGGTVSQIDVAGSVPRGLPRPCVYEVQARELERWTFDIDCRDGMKQRAEALFAQYKATSDDHVQHYRALADAGAIKPSDAGSERAPEAAVAVAVGTKALDHHGQGLIFIDDDAPCYVRVVGRDAARRLELAKLIAHQLTFANAPMTPRAAP
jgi:hypothetical protein